MSWHSTSPSSVKHLFGTRRDGLCSLLQQHHSVFLRPWLRAQVFPCARKGRVGEVLRLSFIVVRNGHSVVFWQSFSLCVWYVFYGCQFGFLTIRRKTLRGSRWFRQARKLPLTAWAEWRNLPGVVH